jgi:Zn finger protein HypA/HybF involved in hydrogenase expression
MHEHGLAKELWPQMQRLASERGFRKVSRVGMVVGMLHGVSADFLAHSFEHAFEGSGFAGAAVEITIVEPGESFAPPGREEPLTAGGWELVITYIEGEK